MIANPPSAEDAGSASLFHAGRNASYPIRARVPRSRRWGMKSPRSSRRIQAAFLKFKTAILINGREVARNASFLGWRSWAKPARGPVFGYTPAY